MDIKIEINNIRGKILNPLNINQLSVIQNLCSFKVEGSEFKANAFRHRGKGSFEWDGYRKLFNVRYQTFPIGLLDIIRGAFTNAGIPVEIIDKRKKNNETIQYKISNYGIRDYQTNAVLLSVAHGNGIVKAATGAGKTTIAARTISALQKRTIFIVHTRDLLYQTIESFQRMFPYEKIGQIGDGEIDYQNITVATMQTLAILNDIEIEKDKYDEEADDINETKTQYKEIYNPDVWHKYKNTVDCVMFDEVQRICSQMAYKVRFLFEHANYAFGYSASPWRDDGSDLMIEAAFGKRIVDITASELIRQGYLVRPQIIIKSAPSIWSGKTYEQIYRSAIVENVFRNMQVVQDALEQYNLGRNTLILVTQIKHGQLLEKMLGQSGMPAVFISGKSGMKKRRQTIDNMRSGKAQLVIASTIADVGLDVPRLQSIIEAGAGKSSVTALQRLGRIMRPFEGKKECYFITYKDNAPYLSSQIDKKIDIWSTEKEFIIDKRYAT
jgi:superfamily II DNA or RNA helicase